MKNRLPFICLILLVARIGLADPKTLFQQMQKLATTGNAEAQYHLGMMYHNGMGHEVDQRKAFELFQKAAEAKDPLGAFKLGCYYDGQVPSVVNKGEAKALKYKTISADAGYSLAQLDVGNHYANKNDFEKAFKYWKEAADQGEAQSMFNLSYCYLMGKGTKKDVPMAYAYFMLSKLRNEGKINSEAQAQLNELKKNFSKDDLGRAEALVKGWQPKRTPLTEKALSGVKAAEALVSH